MVNIKPLEGIITDWALFNNRIRGTFALGYHAQADVGAGEIIVTSPVVRICKLNGVLMAETANSLYALI